MNIYRTTIAALIAMAVAPGALAQVYKCEGPDGPVYSDRECGPAAAQVEFKNSSGVSGVSDETKTGLAEKKAQRAQNRNNRSSSNNAPVVNYQSQPTTFDNGVGEYWPRRINRPVNRIPGKVPEKPIQRPTRPIVTRRR